MNSLNPMLFEVAGVAIPLAKALSSGGLLMDIVGVAILVRNEILSRRRELREAVEAQMGAQIMAREAQAVPKDGPVGGRIFYPADGIREALRSTAEHAKAVRYMNWRVWVGIVLVLGGFVLQLVGTLIS